MLTNKQRKFGKKIKYFKFLKNFDKIFSNEVMYGFDYRMTNKKKEKLLLYIGIYVRTEVDWVL